MPAATGQLIFLCSGSKSLFDEVVQSGFKAMGKASHFFSEDVGVGTRAKLVVNALMATMMAAFGESLKLAENVGLDPMKIIEVLGQGAIQVLPVYHFILNLFSAFILTGILSCCIEPHVCFKRAQDDSGRPFSQLSFEAFSQGYSFGLFNG
jgi:hypothetical protein